jgi:hypothetical protein
VAGGPAGVGCGGREDLQCGGGHPFFSELWSSSSLVVASPEDIHGATILVRTLTLRTGNR